jgi:hypothetical protein
MKTTVRALLVLSSLSLLHAQEAVVPKLPEGPLLMRVSAPTQHSRESGRLFPSHEAGQTAQAERYHRDEG